jgi:hypothetical protein
MYFVSEEFNTAAQARARQILVKALFNGDRELTGKNLIDMTVTEAVGASGGLTMGSTISSKLTLSLRMPEEPLPLEGGWIEPYIGYYGVDEYCPLGKFYITKVESKDDFVTATIEAYDAFSKTEKRYEPGIAMPNTATAIVNDIARQCGFSVSKTLTDYPDVQIGLYGLTCRQYLGYIAGLVGKNARFDRNGELAFQWYSYVSYNIPAIYQYMGGLKKTTESDIVVQSITSGTSDKIIVAGNGTGFSFENPFMTQEILNNIFKPINGAQYTPAQLKWRGNPSLEAGDIVLVEDKNGNPCTVYVMEQVLKISGGFQSEIKCFGKSDAEVKFDTSPQAKKLQQVYTNLQTAIKEATELLKGANGGVFEVLDGNGDGVNDGWIIHSLDKLQHIKATVDGIGITTDGGATYKEAITTRGINASAITTGALNAERIAVESYDEENPAKLTDYIRFGNGIITLGKGNSAVILKLENDQIAFYNASGDRLGCFTDNSFEIENLTDGQIRFQNFGFIPRKSGNMSFTKLK